jgi:Flp pilus assembly protein TadB
MKGDDALHKLLVTMGDIAERSLRNSETIGFLFRLETALYLLAIVATIVFIVYLPYGYSLLAIVSATLWILALVVTVLYGHYYIKTLKEFEKLAKLAVFVSASAKLDELHVRLEKEIQELEQMLREKGITSQ